MNARGAGIAVVVLLLASACARETIDADRAPAPMSSPRSDVGSWSRGADMPTPRTEVAVAALGGKVYVAGGFTEDGQATEVVEVYDPASDSWDTPAPLPMALHHAGLVGAGDRLYVIGGYTSEGAPSDRVWSRSANDDSWREESSMPTPRGALAVAWFDTHDGGPVIYAVGGATGFGGGARLTGKVEMFQPRAAGDRWRTEPDLPHPRDHLAAAVTGQSVHVIGGRELSLSRNLARHDVFIGGMWEREDDMRLPRGGLASAAVRNRLFVFGGEQPGGTFDAVEVYDTADETWTVGPPMPTARHGLGAAAIGEKIYVIGGGPEPGLSVSGANEILTLR